MPSPNSSAKVTSPPFAIDWIWSSTGMNLFELLLQVRHLGFRSRYLAGVHNVHRGSRSTNTLPPPERFATVVFSLHSIHQLSTLIGRPKLSSFVRIRRSHSTRGSCHLGFFN